MDVREAQALLDVSGTDEPRSIRRAYLKKLRVFSPETDPVGFMRLRTAYELLTEIAGPERAGPPPRAQVLVESQRPGSQADDAVIGLTKAEAPAGQRSVVPATSPAVQRRELHGLVRRLRAAVATGDPSIAPPIESFVAFCQYAEPLPLEDLAAYLLWLQAEAPLETAQRATLQVRELLQNQPGDSQSLPSPEALAQWVFAQELCRLPETLPRNYRTQLAEAPLGDGSFLQKEVTHVFEHTLKQRFINSAVTPNIYAFVVGRQRSGPAPLGLRSAGIWGLSVLVLLLLKVLVGEL